MTQNRIKLTRPLVDTRAKAEEILGEIAVLTLERNGATIQMDRELTAVRENYDAPIAAYGKQIAEKTALLEGWASANPEEFPKDRKSIDMVHGTVGFRTGTPKLKTLFRKTWEAVKETLKAFGLIQFVRGKEEVDKEKIIAAYQAKEIGDNDLKKVGVAVVQDETFFVEPKLEELTSRTTQEAA